MKTIELTRGKVTLVNDEDFEWLSIYTWGLVRSGKKFYVYTKLTVNGKLKHLFMHRMILEAKKDELSDHINGDSLDNRRRNLRICNSKQNHHNRKKFKGKSKYKGVSWHKRARKWQAVICLNYVSRYLGNFDNEEEAGRAYDAKAKVLFGEFARLNFPEEKL